jgi:GT2 family glycosyltransferase
MSTESHSRENLPPTSLIICSRNRPKFLVEAVVSIFQGDQVPTELIIIDQSDTPHPTLVTMTNIRNCDIRYLWTQSVGLSRANNEGIAAARYDLLVFTHDDIFVTPTWFGTLVQALCDAGSHSVVTGQVRPTSLENPGGFYVTTKVDLAPAIYAGRVGQDVLFPLNMAMYRSAVQEVGDFDERLGPGTPFPGAEDNDIGFRLLEAGYRILYVPEAALYHRAWRAKRDYLPLRWAYGLARGAFYAKYLTLRDHYILARMVKDVRNHILFFFQKFHHSRSQALGDAVLVLGILTGIVRWWLTQQSISQSPGAGRFSMKNIRDVRKHKSETI